MRCGEDSSTVGRPHGTRAANPRGPHKLSARCAARKSLAYTMGVQIGCQVVTDFGARIVLFAM
jgi:hypothetical protein